MFKGENAMPTANITHQRLGKYTYIDESVPFWNKEKKYPDNRKTRIGKVDPLTGESMYKPEYLEKLRSQGANTEGMRVWDTAGEARSSFGGGTAEGFGEEIASMLDSVKDFGTMYFLTSIAKRIGLTGALSAAMPYSWERVFDIACYLVATGKPAMYCGEWSAETFGTASEGLSSQRASDMYASFGFAERMAFYREWARLAREREYLALDITSISSYSQGIKQCEMGHNRDKEKLPQVNVCILCGEKSHTPVYLTLYSGSLGDVSTLECTLEEFEGVVGAAGYMVVMDKGNFSFRNLRALNGADGRRTLFLIPAPFTTAWAKMMAEAEMGGIDRPSNVILTSGAPVRGVYRPGAIKGIGFIHAHVFFDPERALRKRNELYDYVARLKAEAVRDAANPKLQKEFAHYLTAGPAPGVREDVVAEELKTAGWLVLASNHIGDPQLAFDTYRAKDAVEKAFMAYKDMLGLHRLRVHGDVRMENKLFVAFIALAMYSHIHRVMKEKRLYARMTFDGLMITLAKLKSARVGGKLILRPVTRAQKDIFDAFGLACPCGACM
jgi:hypothetical protein